MQGGLVCGHLLLSPTRTVTAVLLRFHVLPYDLFLFFSSLHKSSVGQGKV